MTDQRGNAQFRQKWGFWRLSRYKAPGANEGDFGCIPYRRTTAGRLRQLQSPQIVGRHHKFRLIVPRSLHHKVPGESTSQWDDEEIFSSTIVLDPSGFRAFHFPKNPTVLAETQGLTLRTELWLTSAFRHHSNCPSATLSGLTDWDPAPERLQHSLHAQNLGAPIRPGESSFGGLAPKLETIRLSPLCLRPSRFGLIDL